MQCDKCGCPANIGDQYCLNCGAKLNSSNAIMPGIDKFEIEDKKDHKNMVFLVALGIVLITLLIISILFMGNII